MEVEVVKLRFFNEQRDFYAVAGGIPLAAGDVVIVETEEGMDCCEVVAEAKRCPRLKMKESAVSILRRATPNDLEWLATKQVMEDSARRACEELAANMGLEMGLEAVKMAFDGSKIVFFFTADQRVDFRGLVKELAKRFRTRIEMRQIGVRDKARSLGGFGICGRQLCCSSFLRDFVPVTMKMAKEQNLTLSPTKISGYCGRLMCCLAYENEHYRDARHRFPRLGARVGTPQGPGEVQAHLPLAEAVMVALDAGVTIKVKLTDLNLGLTTATAEPAAPSKEKKERTLK